ncbi:MAG: hypothetical protein M3069_01230, partial [Chloroflexota bacterium]|nr:hypothetical protein [Chloroflexota bacterium]
MPTISAQRPRATSVTETESLGELGRPPESFLGRLPAAVFVVAALAGLLHIAPVWRAQTQVPAGWTFTGNLTISPDYMQYRVWERLSQLSGILVADTFTSEPNQPHLLVPF